jgi:hypothetical protein
MHLPVRTLSNSWSNICYWVVGCAILSVAIEDSNTSEPHRRNSAFFLQRWPSFSALIGFGCCYLAVGSFCFHASLSAAAHRTDLGGMFAVFAAFFSFSLFKFVHTTKRGTCQHIKQSANLFLVCPVLTLIILQLLPVRVELQLGVLCMLGFGILEFSPCFPSKKSRLQQHVRLMSW